MNPNPNIYFMNQWYKLFSSIVHIRPITKKFLKYNRFIYMCITYREFLIMNNYPPDEMPIDPPLKQFNSFVIFRKKCFKNLKGTKKIINSFIFSSPCAEYVTSHFYFPSVPP